MFSNLIRLSLVLALFFWGCQNNKHKKAEEKFSLSDYLYKDSLKIFQISDIVDGDTYKILIAKQEFKVRLIGIDTPEATNNPKSRREAQREAKEINSIIELGKISTRFVRDHISKGDSIRLELDMQEFDQYDRILAYVFLMDGRMLNEIIIKEGYAMISTYPPNVKYQELFLDAQRYARENKKGLWADSITTL